MDQPIHLISTRRLKSENKEKLEKLGFSIEDYDFVEIQHTLDTHKTEILKKNISPLVFTSQNAVRSIEGIIPELSQKQAFAIEGITADEARKAGLNVVGTARDASNLGIIIIDSAPESVLHVTSNIRRNELERALSEAHIAIQILEVYEKIPKPRKIETLDAMLFWSPSQVDAFLVENSLDPETLIFSIGNTTTIHLRRLFFENVITIAESSEENMLETVIAHFAQP